MAWPTGEPYHILLQATSGWHAGDSKTIVDKRVLLARRAEDLLTAVGSSLRKMRHKKGPKTEP